MSFVLEGGQESKSPETQTGTDCGAKYQNRQAENDLNNKEATSGELSTKTMKAVTQVKEATGTETRNSLEMNYQKAAAEAISK